MVVVAVWPSDINPSRRCSCAGVDLDAGDAVVQLAHIGDDVTIAGSIAKLADEDERGRLAAVSAVWQLADKGYGAATDALIGKLHDNLSHVQLSQLRALPPITNVEVIS